MSERTLEIYERLSCALEREPVFSKAWQEVLPLIERLERQLAVAVKGLENLASFRDAMTKEAAESWLKEIRRIGEEDKTTGDG